MNTIGDSLKSPHDTSVHTFNSSQEAETYAHDRPSQPDYFKKRENDARHPSKISCFYTWADVPQSLRPRSPGKKRGTLGRPSRGDTLPPSLRPRRVACVSSWIAALAVGVDLLYLDSAVHADIAPRSNLRKRAFWCSVPCRTAMSRHGGEHRHGTISQPRSRRRLRQAERVILDCRLPARCHDTGQAWRTLLARSRHSSRVPPHALDIIAGQEAYARAMMTGQARIKRIQHWQ